MITLYTWATPNGRKASIMLEEIGAAYEVRPVNIGKGQQFAPDFLAVSPNNKIPAIVDHEGDGAPRTLFETAAILLYLADKAGRFVPPPGPERDRTTEWLIWSVAGLGPMFGQWNYFANRAPEKVPAAIERFTTESLRLIGVLERRLSDAPYLGGDQYGVADISAFTWMRTVFDKIRDQAGSAWAGTPEIDRWMSEIDARPAVTRGMAIPKV